MCCRNFRHYQCILCRIFLFQFDVVMCWRLCISFPGRVVFHPLLAAAVGSGGLSPSPPNHLLCKPRPSHVWVCMSVLCKCWHRNDSSRQLRPLLLQRVSESKQMPLPTTHVFIFFLPRGLMNNKLLRIPLQAYQKCGMQYYFVSQLCLRLNLLIL